MSFQYSAIGDNTPENREHLEKLGYEEIDKLSCPCLSLITNNSGVFFASPMSISNRPNIINCIGNPALFQAVTAMREDSDYMQWFVREESESDIILETDNIDNWVLCEINNFQEFGEYFGVYHKASLAELEEHFK